VTDPTHRVDDHHRPGLPRCAASGKIGYPTQARARQELLACLEARREGRLHRLERAVYQCPACQDWHLTSRPYTALAADDPPPIVEQLRARFGK
jgi:hypothetical protein